MEDASCGIEAEVLVRGYSWGEPALGSGPFDGKHVVCTFSRLSFLPRLLREEGSLPVNVRPKTSSSGDTSSLSVVAVVIERAEGFMPGSLAIASSCDCML